MRPLLLAGGCLLALVLGTARADERADPLRLVPSVADLVVTIEQPRTLLEGALNNPLFVALQKLEAIREFYESTNYRRSQQLLAYFEKKLGTDRLELLDRLAGGGMAVGVKFGPQPAPVLLAIQGKDEHLLQRFMSLGLQVLDQELARQESKDRLEKSAYRGVDIYHVGKDKFYTAAAGNALLLSNLEKGVRTAIDLHLDGQRNSIAQNPTIAEARVLLGSDAAAWIWLNMGTVRKAPGAKDIFTLPRNDAVLTVLFGDILDLGGRAPFVCAGLYPQNHGYLFSVRTPVGREGATAALAVHVPPGGQPGSRPLLEPREVLYSSSYFLDLAQFWEQRAKLFNAKQVKAFEDFNKSSRVFLAGSEFSKLLAQAGPYQRLVAVPQLATSYKSTPIQRIPAFGIVVEMREPDAFGKKLTAILRSLALLATTQVKLKPMEEQHAGKTIVSYRFSEDDSYAADTDNYRFNFSPSFAVVGKQFVASSTIELCRELVDVLDKEARENPHSSPATARSQVYAAGGAELLETLKDRLFAQTMLDQAMSPTKASEQVKAFIDWVRQLGVLQFEQNYKPRDFRLDIRLIPAASRK
ncbi:MAG TPA: DUF3352 domain-containing protein [Gemmataceae bacterium]|nr:DUF3352 domain-containing protein [Gemmataceae bacterium]